MTVLARFRALPDKDKASLVRKLIVNGTPDFDYFYLIGLSTLMATLGLLLNSSAIVIGSMLIAPLMYPILGFALGLVMMGEDTTLLRRAAKTLLKSLSIALGLSVVAAFFFGNEASYYTAEIMARTEPSHLHFLIAIVAGAAVAYMLARPEWNASLPGVAIAIALLDPLATVGIGIAAGSATIIKGATMILALNLFGIMSIAVITFLLMNLIDKKNIVDSTLRREAEKLASENKVVAEVDEQILANKEFADEKTTIIREDIVSK